jgi:hypothetical protein
MDGLQQFLEEFRRKGITRGHFLGFLNVLIGRSIKSNQGDLISSGLTWRFLAQWLKKLHWDTEAVRELGIDPARLPPRDRQRFWYAAIGQARVDSEEAMQAGDKFAAILQSFGYLSDPPSRNESKGKGKGGRKIG